MDDPRKSFGTIRIVQLNASITSDISLQLNVNSRWSFAAWLKGNAFEFSIFKTCYHLQNQQTCEGLGVYDQSLYWERSIDNNHDNTERHQFGSQKIFTDSRIGHHIFMIHYARAINVYLDGRPYANWFVPDEFMSPSMKVRNITFG